MIKSGDTENALEDWEHDKRGMTAGWKILGQLSYTVGSVSRKGPFPTGLFWALYSSSVEWQSSRFHRFALFLEAVGVGTTVEWQSRVGWELCASCVLREQRVLRVTNPRPSGLVALGLAESRQSYSKRSRCWQNVIDTARCFQRRIHAAGGLS